MQLDEKLDENFLKEFKDVYQAINIIGSELFKLRDQIAKISEDISAVKSDVSLLKGEVQMVRSKMSQATHQALTPSSQPQHTPSPQADSPAGQQASPEQAAKKDEPRRLRTGEFQPGDKRIDIANVFYYGNRK